MACFGGTFDPFHNGHLSVIKSVTTISDVSEVIIIPNNVPPHKAQARASAQERLEMLELAVSRLNRENPEITYSISSLELNRPGPSYTIDTVKSFAQTYPDAELLYIIGSDSYFQFHTWKSYMEIPAYVTLIIVGREAFSEKEAELYYKQYLCKFPFSRFRFLYTVSSNISSTVIRKLINKHQDISSMVPKDIWEYIQKKGLYK
ncbi:nicotinate (nicotinamide) nucleotide adenylyltransferase [Thermoproteota archaeon]